MKMFAMSSCCGIGEIRDLKEPDYYRFRNVYGGGLEGLRKERAAIAEGDIDYLVERITKLRDSHGEGHTKAYPTIIVATPDKDDWWMFHIVLPIAGFRPVAWGKTMHNATYNNILWVFERNNSD